MSTASDLRSYRHWIGKTPHFILTQVRQVGGWGAVFRDRLPAWASRVRNFFNDTPTTLSILPLRENLAARKLVRTNRFDVSTSKHPVIYRGNNTLPYNLWVTYRKEGSVLHYEWSGDHSDLTKSVMAFFTEKELIPVFKLVCPDGTGGSSEIVIHNWQLELDRSTPWNHNSGAGGGRAYRHGQKTVGGMKPGDKAISIRTKLVVTPEFRGSYNYGDAANAGFLAHDRMDMSPDKVAKDPFHIIFPPRGVSFASRRFPERDNRGRSILVE